MPCLFSSGEVLDTNMKMGQEKKWRQYRMPNFKKIDCEMRYEVSS